MRRRLRERSRAPAGAADLLRLSPSHAGTARLAGGIVEGELRTGPWRSRAAREGAESRAICSSCHGARACVWAHWSIGPLVLVCRGGASMWQSTNLARSLWARARIPRPSPIHPSSGRLSRQRSSRTGPLLSHAERAALAWRFAAKRWSIGRTAGRPSVTQASGSHRGRLCRPGAPLEGPHAEFQRIVRVAQSPTRARFSSHGCPAVSGDPSGEFGPPSFCSSILFSINPFRAAVGWGRLGFGACS